ncbi:phage portal protein [Rhodopila sp.]|uniref:phage portal protein n=1 Tax=Rhodopila sp. TaxID=2480087 RepID=UPI003D0CDB8C
MTILDSLGQPMRPLQATPPRPRAALTEGAIGAGFPYDAQVPYSQDMADWQPWLRGPDAEINFDRDRVVARTRDIVRNDGWARGGIVGRIADAAIGADFHPIPAPNWRALSRHDKAFDATWAAEFAAAVRSEWSLWADDLNFQSDAARTLTMTQQCYLAFMHYLIDGDALGMNLWAPERAGPGAARYSTVHQVIDPDRLSNPYQMVDTHDRRGGVQVDDFGAPVGYHIRQAHQNDWYDAERSMIWEFFPRETPWGRPVVVHFFDKERADQHRGNSVLTPILSRFKMLSKYDTATLQAAVLRTIVGFFLKSPYDPEQVRMAIDNGTYGDGAGDPEDVFVGMMGARAQWNKTAGGVSLGGVRMPLLAPGESIETAAGGNHADDFDAFETSFLRNFAATTGQSYEEVSGDFRHTNYSSFRGAMLQAWRTLVRRRASFASRYGAQIYGAWLEEALDTHLADILPANAPPFADLRSAYAHAKWIGPGRGWVDPVKEPQGEVLKLDAAMTTLQDVTSNISGRYYLDVLDERAVEQAQMKARGLRLPDWAGLPAQDVEKKPLAE